MSALERLAELVRQTESKSRAQKLGAETEQAAERLAAAEDRARRAAKRLQEVRPVRQRELDQADTEDVQLREFMKKLAQQKSISALSPEEEREAERLIKAVQEEITAKRREAQAELEAVLRESDEARRELRQARELYDRLRREMDQIRPELAAEFATADRLAREAETFLPAGQIQALAREVADGEPHFGVLDQRQQLAQLRIWVGRFRRLQAWHEAGQAPDLTEDEVAQLREIFPRLVGISKQYWPGYIEAFSRSFETDWDAYVADAEEQMRQAIETARLTRETENRRREIQHVQERRQRENVEAGQAALDELKTIVAGYRLPDEGAEEFLSTLARVVSGLGASDPQVLELVRPYQDLLGGKEFRALRRRLETMDQDQSRREETDTLRAQIQDLLAATRGYRVLMIGGSVREDARRSLEQVFDFDELEWEPYEGSRPAALKSLEQRVRNHGVDLLLILKDFVGHHVSERLRPLCEENGIPCLMVEHGYGAAQVAEALRNGLSKLAGAGAEGDLRS